MCSVDRLQVVKLEIFLKCFDLVFVASVVFTEVARPVVPALNRQISLAIDPGYKLHHVDVADDLWVTPGEGQNIFPRVEVPTSTSCQGTPSSGNPEAWPG